MATVDIKPMHVLYALVVISIGLSIFSLVDQPQQVAEPIEFPKYDFEKIVADNIDDAQIIKIYQTSDQWDWIKGQVTNAEETNDIVTLGKRVDTLSREMDVLEAKLYKVENPPASSKKDEIVSMYTSDNDGNKEDRFNQGEIVYVYITVDTDETRLDYKIINDDMNDTVKSKRLSISDSSGQLVWAWVIPENQLAGEYYVEVEVGNTIKQSEFIIR